MPSGGHVAPRARGVPFDDLGRIRVPDGGGRRADGGVGRFERDAVHDQQSQVRQRIAERGHLPVQDRVDPVVGADQHVVEPVVAVHDGRCGGVGERAPQGRVQFVDPGQLAVPGRLQLLAPAAQLAVEEALRTPEVRESHLGGIHRVQLDQRVHQPEHRVAGALRAERDELLRGAVRRALHELHDVEGRSQHRLVLTQQYRARHRDRRRVQRADHPVLALHVVCGGQYMPERRPPYDPLRAAVRDRVGEVRPSALDQPAGQRAVHQPGSLAVEQAAQLVEIEPWRMVRGHRCSYAQGNRT
jgi:hypothetical protein